MLFETVNHSHSQKEKEKGICILNIPMPEQKQMLKNIICHFGCSSNRKTPIEKRSGREKPDSQRFIPMTQHWIGGQVRCEWAFGSLALACSSQSSDLACGLDNGEALTTKWVRLLNTGATLNRNCWLNGVSSRHGEDLEGSRFIRVWQRRVGTARQDAHTACLVPSTLRPNPQVGWPATKCDKGLRQWEDD